MKSEHYELLDTEGARPVKMWTRGVPVGRDEGSWDKPPAAWMQLKDEFDALCLKWPKLRHTNHYKHLGTLGSGNRIAAQFAVGSFHSSP